MLRILTRLWSEDSSTPIGKNNRKTDREEQKKDKQSRQQRKRGQQHNTRRTNQTGGEEGGQVLKNLTRLWPGSSSTLTRNRINQERPNPQIDTRQSNQAAHAAVREKGAIRGEGKGNNKLEALTVFSQKIQAQE